MKFKAIIFDLDGVICFTDEYHYRAWKALADRLNAPFDRTINNRLRGVSRMASLEIVLETYTGPELSEEEKVALATEKNEMYRESLKQMSPADLSDEVRETLDALRAKGLKLAIGSSSKNTPFILKQIGLDGYFDAVSDGNNISRSKPDPEVFLKAAEFLGMDPADCLVVEDAVSGAEAGHAGEQLQRAADRRGGINPAADGRSRQIRFSEKKQIHRGIRDCPVGQSLFPCILHKTPPGFLEDESEKTSDSSESADLPNKGKERIIIIRKPAFFWLSGGEQHENGMHSTRSNARGCYPDHLSAAGFSGAARGEKAAGDPCMPGRRIFQLFGPGGRTDCPALCRNGLSQLCPALFHLL